MQSYLVENQHLLSLDNDDFKEPNVVEEELTLKEGRSSRDGDGRIDLLVEYQSEYRGIVEIKLGQLDHGHLDQLGDYLLRRDKIASKDFEPKWIGLLVGSAISPDLEKDISDGVPTKDGVPIAAITIQRFRDRENNVFLVADTFFKRSVTSKDATKYKFNEETFGKGRLVLAVLKHHVQKNPTVTYADLVKDFPKSNPPGVFATRDEADEKFRTSGHKRYYLAPEDLIRLPDCTIAVSNQWGIGNIDGFINVAKNLGYEILPRAGEV